MLPAINIMCIYRKTSRVPLSVRFLLKRISFLILLHSFKTIVDEVAVFFGLHALKLECQGVANWDESE